MFALKCVMSKKLKAYHFLRKSVETEIPASLLAELGERFRKCQSIPLTRPVSVLRGQRVLMLVGLCINS